ncbi:AAA domain-containing protein [Devosia sp. ZB163]|uniref:AAA domain-containing protein n=1 Tax=Devosia sp. ZB163 TaxID=3025938 RepID=UPI00235E7E6B|nr:AAA domain-containing protein [Devosia sp. ZB163]MDC9824818.1 AAA domain-containing protein [Devosia sp. ZB163]
MTVRADLLNFLRDPAAFAARASDPDVWRAGLDGFAKPELARAGDQPLVEAQVLAWEGLADARVGLLLGPPGTGKTHLLSWLILGYVHARHSKGLPARVFVSGFTRNAIGNVLDGVAKRAAKYSPGAFATHFVGTGPAAGLSSLVRHRQSVSGTQAAAALADLQPSSVVMGGSIWSLYRMMQRPEARGDGYTSELFDLVCIDEASQMVLGQGLMAMAGIKQTGRIVVAGDDQQLPPIRAGREIKLGDRELGGSLYSFLKSSRVPEFALDTTFRLNGPLAAFPERKFYAGKYVSAVPSEQLKLIEGWRDGLDSWEQAVLDPNWPIAILLHDGPPAATRNPFEATLAARVATLLADRLIGAKAGGSYQAQLWQEHLAVVSPHRAQNAAIRSALPDPLAAGSFVETVDRIQGKERDTVILSYCVADAEFAVAEADFIFAPERLNVAVTRAKTKLVVIVSRRLLDAVPGDQEAMDKAEILREFIFSAAPSGDVPLLDPSGVPVTVQVRLLGFDGPPQLQDFATAQRDRLEPQPLVLTRELQDLLDAVVQSASTSPYRKATLNALAQRLATRATLLPGLALLHAMGHVALTQPKPDAPDFWLAQPLDPQRIIFAANLDTVRARLEEAINQVRQGRLPPFYWKVRDRFAWMDATGRDVFRPVIESLRNEGLVAINSTGQHLTVEWLASDLPKQDPAPIAEEPELSDDDFRVLNLLEDIEAARINFGVFEGWTSIATLADRNSLRRQSTLEAITRLSANGWVFQEEDGRVRSRMAELARELRQVKQRFQRDDAATRPYLVRSLKVEIRDRDKPARDDAIETAFGRAAEGVNADYRRALGGLAGALADLWGSGAKLALFQSRSLVALTEAWSAGTHDAYAIAADTGSGKTEAAALPLIAGAAADVLAGIQGVRAILTYPRIRLAANQAQRLAGYLAALSRQGGMPTVTLGLQVGQVPERLDRLGERETEAGWAALGSDSFAFPLFGCPACGSSLLLRQGAGVRGADELACTSCTWTFTGWIGSKERMREQPPALFLPTTDSLHQWLHDPRYGRLFGDDAAFAAPRALLADEIHLYSHVHGAQVGYAMRRMSARVALNNPSGHTLLTVGMSATLGDPADAWGRLVDRENVVLLTPLPAEKVPNPRGREYFYFVQPEVESRGKDVAGNSTTIQSVMALTHGMRRRTGRSGGFRSLVFLDSVDKLRRLHAAYDDAETAKNLSAYRTRLYSDDPVTGAPREGCCGNPVGCDLFSDGECWLFAATDRRQTGSRGRTEIGRPLRVAPQPIFSGTAGRVESLLKDSDVIFATSSLEVGYDDPDISLVYQHYAPRNLASFIQRKGRGGRGADDRPITGVTLSIYNSRDSWWFRRPEEMISPSSFESPLNPDNHFVRRGQLVATILDGLSRRLGRGGAVDLERPSAPALADAEQLAIEIFGPEPWREFGFDSLSEFFAAALGSGGGSSPKYLSDLRKRIDWAPDVLFETVNLPTIQVATGTESARAEDVALSLSLAAPGNASRRYDPIAVYWRPPIQGNGPWLSSDDYRHGTKRRPFGDDAQGWLRQLPDHVALALANLSPDYFRPSQITLETLGRKHGTGWQSDWAVPAPTFVSPIRVQGNDNERERVRDDARGFLRGFPVVKATPERARQVASRATPAWLERVEAYLGDGVGGRETGLALARVYWGADAELNLEGPPAQSVAFSQIFTSPDDDRPMLHGYHVQSEGVRFVLNAELIGMFVDEEVRRLTSDPSDRQWHLSQMMRFLVVQGAEAVGINTFDAHRAAELLLSAYADPELSGRMAHLSRFWSKAALAALFEDTRARLLSRHPLLSPSRVSRVADNLSGQAFQQVFQKTMAAVRAADSLPRYLQSVVVHSLASRLKDLFVRWGQGDERQVIMHVELPIMFSRAADMSVTICEVGAFGDGTTRAFVDKFERAEPDVFKGYFGDCPNAREDAVVDRLLGRAERHDAWRAIDATDVSALRSLAGDLGLAPGESIPSAALRLLFGQETVGIEQFPLYDLAISLRGLNQGLAGRFGRDPTAWELTSAAVAEAIEQPDTIAGRLLHAYADIEASVQEESLSADGRLAEQVFRLHPRLCVDGCAACVHQESDMMSDGMLTASTSRRLLDRFLGAVSVTK